MNEASIVPDERTVLENHIARKILGELKTPAFTLAEVLITLLIIGIVAAMTIPTMMYNYKKKVIETRLVNFYTQINEAIKLSEDDNGDKDGWDEMKGGWNAKTRKSESGFDENGNSYSYIWYEKYLKPYVKTIKVEVSESFDGMTKLYFLNGSMFTFWKNAYYFFPYASDYKEVVNEDGKKEFDKTFSGRKYFVFYWDAEKGIVPYGDSSTFDFVKNNTYTGCNANVTNEPACCTSLIQRNGWKIPDDYPFRL